MQMNGWLRLLRPGALRDRWLRSAYALLLVGAIVTFYLWFALTNLGRID